MTILKQNEIKMPEFGGKGHSLQHYNDLKLENKADISIVIKLGTITPERADIWDYKTEDWKRCVFLFSFYFLCLFLRFLIFCSRKIAIFTI